MDYYSKYKKYKSKYMNLKGGNLNRESCPETAPFFCNTFDNANYGLCKESKDDCYKEYIGEQTLPNIISDTSGSAFGYGDFEPTKNCRIYEINNSYEYDIQESKIPSTFKIITYNIWGKKKKGKTEEETLFEENFFNKRMESICKIIKNSNADIVCLQEVSNDSYEKLKELKEIYPYFYENPFQCDIDLHGNRKRDLETFIFSKYPCKKFSIISLQGNQNWNNSMSVIEFDNLIILNTYLQAGTKLSPGQEKKWFHYSRCRYNEFMSISDFLKKYNKGQKPIIMVGDFNTNLDGNEEDWPELKALKTLDLDDSWNNITTNGNTENTDINRMRYYFKFQEKNVRVDGILFSKNMFNVKNAQIIGNESIETTDEERKGFIDFRTNISKISNISDVNFWPSDHFGVLAELEIF